MYYLFIIKNKYYKVSAEYLYKLLYKIKYIKKEEYNYGISIYYDICNFFNIKIIKNYLNKKYKIQEKNNKYYLDENNYFEIRNSYCLINNKKYLREILCIFYIYNKNIFVCNFDKNSYFWLKDKFK